MITDQDLELLGARPLTALDRIKLVCIAALYPVAFLHQLSKFFLPSHPQYDLHWRQKTMLASIHAANTFQSQKRITYAASHTKTTSERVREFAKKRKGLEHREVSVPIDAVAAAAANPATGGPVPPPTLHFLSGPWMTGATRKDGPVILYAHGGGYLEPIATGAHIPLARSMARACGAREVVLIAYALCPEAQYPAQLVQVVEAVRLLLEREGVAPGDLVLAGDSAGAHLVASLLAHVAEPAPYARPLAPALGGGGGQFRAAVLLSPWFTWTDAASLGTNVCDFLAGPHVASLVRVLRPRVDDVWCEIVAAPRARDVWARVFATTTTTTTTGGEGEGKGEGEGEGEGAGAGEDDNDKGGGRPLVKRLLVTASDSETMYRDARIFAVEYARAASVVMGAGDAGAELERVMTEPRVFAVGRRETHVQPGLDEAVKYHGGGTWRALQAFMSSL